MQQDLIDRVKSVIDETFASFDMAFGFLLTQSRALFAPIEGNLNQDQIFSQMSDYLIKKLNDCIPGKWAAFFRLYHSRGLRKRPEIQYPGNWGHLFIDLFVPTTGLKLDGFDVLVIQIEG